MRDNIINTPDESQYESRTPTNYFDQHEDLLKVRTESSYRTVKMTVLSTREPDNRGKMFYLVRTRDIGVTKFNFICMFI